MVCCAVLEAAVAAQALRLPCRRRALALLQLALAVVRHYMYARATLILVAADPGLFGICFGSVSVFYQAAARLDLFEEMRRGMMWRMLAFPAAVVAAEAALLWVLDSGVDAPAWARKAGSAMLFTAGLLGSQ
ncbi:hypothetical protein ZWY2020_017944 [Hordeum vulgare]|nr:hypothetical protein ZWY2020_017944 [Hordeum vulgare]